MKTELKERLQELATEWNERAKRMHDAACERCNESTDTGIAVADMIGELAMELQGALDKEAR